MKSSPARGRARAKHLVLQLVDAAGPGGFEGKTRLFKAFYFAHLYFLEDTGRLLTSWPIVRMPRGPGIDQADGLLAELATEGMLLTEKIMTGPYPSVRYRLSESVDREKLRPGNVHEVEAIQRSARHTLERNSEELTAEVHEYSRAWASANNGEALDLARDTMTEEEERAMAGLLDRSHEDLKSAWGD